MPKLFKSIESQNNRKPKVERYVHDNDKFYKSQAWTKTSKAYRKKYPLCESCVRYGRFVKSQMVDHIIPISMGGRLLDWNNLQALCHPCHNRKTAAEKR